MISAVLKNPPSGDSWVNWLRPRPETIPTVMVPFKPKGVADRNHGLAHLQLARIPDGQWMDLLGGTLIWMTRDVGVGVGANDRSIGFIPGGERHFHFAVCIATTCSW